MLEKRDVQPQYQRRLFFWFHGSAPHNSHVLQNFVKHFCGPAMESFIQSKHRDCNAILGTDMKTKEKDESCRGEATHQSPYSNHLSPFIGSLLCVPAHTPHISPRVRLQRTAWPLITVHDLPIAQQENGWSSSSSQSNVTFIKC